ncbi:MAG: hypothetical protein AAF999_06900 [Pseudomonadota bacterium]
MASGHTIAPSKTTALLAYILDMGTDKPLDRAVLEELVNAICINAEERGRLISAVTLSQSPEIRPQVLELLGRRLQRLRDDLEEATDRDEIIGVWSQRVAGGAILAGGGTVLGGLATGGAAVIALALPLAAGIMTTVGRNKLRRRARAARRLCQETERLIELLSL